MLTEQENTNKPVANALLALMCFHSSRFDAKINQYGQTILYEDQDETLWNTALINKGTYYLNQASIGNKLSRYHLEPGIAYWHTHKEDTNEKWGNILQLYNQLLQIEYSPIAALNRTFALAKTKGKEAAIREAQKLNLTNNHFYYSLLGNLYSDIDKTKALQYFETALQLANLRADKNTIARNIDR